MASANAGNPQAKTRTQANKAAQDTRTEDHLACVSVDNGTLLFGAAFLVLARGGLAVLFCSISLDREQSEGTGDGGTDDGPVAAEVRLGVESVADTGDDAHVYEANEAPCHARAEEIVLGCLPEVRALCLCLPVCAAGLLLCLLLFIGVGR